MEALRAFGGMFGAFVPWRRGWGWGAGIGDVMKLANRGVVVVM